MISDEKLIELNKKNIALNQDLIPKKGFWSGCNYYINSGKKDNEPLGTMTSMHDCDVCEEFDTCKLKKDFPIWKK